MSAHADLKSIKNTTSQYKNHYILQLLRSNPVQILEDTHARINVHMHTQAHTQTRAHAHTRIHPRMHALTHTHARTHKHVHTHTHRFIIILCIQSIHVAIPPIPMLFKFVLSEGQFKQVIRFKQVI